MTDHKQNELTKKQQQQQQPKQQQTKAMKQKNRFDGLDVAAMTAQIHRTLLGYKLANVYDGAALSTSSATDSGGGVFLFKLANPSVNAAAAATATDGKKDDTSNAEPSSNRVMLLLESGVRFHTTAFYSNQSDTHAAQATPPSQFAMKLRKHLRNLRLESINQLGNLDRVIDLRFGSGPEYAHHVILELYGMGNLILTNGRYEILALLRVHEYVDTQKKNEDGVGGEDKVVKVRVGNVYPVTYATTIISGSNISTEGGQSQLPSSLLEMNEEQAYQWAKNELLLMKKKADNAVLQEIQATTTTTTKKKKQGKKNKFDGSCNLKMLLLKPNSGVFHYGPSLIEHSILSANLEPNTKFTVDTYESIMPPDAWKSLLEALKGEGMQVLNQFHKGDGKAYILYRDNKAKALKVDDDEEKKNDDVSKLIEKMPHSDKIFEEFQPHLLQQHKNRPHLVYPSFSNAVDEFYSLIEGQKRAIRSEAAEASARDRLAKIQRDQAQRKEALERSMEKLKEHAQLVELHAEDVDNALGVINSAVESGMDWEALEELVQVEKANGNPIALLIKKLELQKNDIVLSLPDTANWHPNDPDSGDVPVIMDVTVSLKESAHGNARMMYDQYRSSKDKAEKTLQASEKALSAAEANAQKQIEAAQQNKKMTFSVMMQPQRKQNWFEKFLWFITSDNYLVLGGRDAQQNEMLVKRYLRPGDAYLHADVHGAPTCILRAKRRRTAKGATEVLPLSNQALQEAGNFAICRSSAWSSRMVTSAWWVESHQVSKTAPTGEYLTVGSFMIRGKKNFLPASQLEMGLGVMFRLGDEASIARHVNERRDFALMTLNSSCGDLIDEDDENDLPPQEKQNSGGNEEKSKGEGGDIISEPSVKAEEDNAEETRNANDDDSSRSIQVEEKKSVNDDNIDGPITKNEETTVSASSESNVGQEKQKKRKGLSARDRKLIKRYGSLEAAEKALAETKVEEKKCKNTKQQKEVNENNGQNQTVPKAKSSGRRSKAKMKKMKKYQDQDDEDKELAILALQGGRNEKKNKGKKGGKAGNNAASLNQLIAAAETTQLLIRNAEEVVVKIPEKVRNILAECVKTKGTSQNEEVRWDKFDAEVLEQLINLNPLDAQVAAANRLHQLTESTRVDNFSASLAGIIRTVQKFGYEGIQLAENEEGGGDKKQRKTKAEKAAEKEAWREILAEDGIIEDDGDTDGGPVDDTAETGKLSGKPVAEDLILYALPVCAPYQTLRNYSYRVKLTPGSQKRGKASKQCLEMFSRTDGGSKRYTELIKAVNENEWVQSICGDVKISAAGASKVMKKQKAGKKRAKNKR